MSVRSRSIYAVLWSAADVFFRRGLGFIVSIALARLLAPEDFGTVALLYIFSGIAGVFIDSGFSAALIQGRNITHTDESTVFWFNILSGAIAAILLWSVAPIIADFYGNALLIPIAQVLAINLFLGSLGSIHATLLTKHLNFKVQMKIGVLATSLSGLVAVTLALNGWGIWALVVQLIVSTLVTTLMLWKLSVWRPSAVFSLASMKRLFEFGGYLFVSGLLDAIYTRGYSLLIGKFYGVRDLGLYSRADNLQQTSSGVITDVISRVAFPVFSSVSHDREMLKKGVRLAVRGTMLINIPAMLGIMAVAEPLVLTLLGEQWYSVAPILQVLCLGAVFYPLHVINLNVLKAQGLSRLFFKVEVYKKTLGICFLVCGVLFGVMGVAWSSALFGMAAFIINAYYTGKYLEYGARAQAMDIFPILALSLGMAGLIMAFDEILVCSYSVKLLILSLVGSCVFLGGILIFRLTAFYEVLGYIKGSKASVRG